MGSARLASGAEQAVTLRAERNRHRGGCGARHGEAAARECEGIAGRSGGGENASHANRCRGTFSICRNRGEYLHPACAEARISRRGGGAVRDYGRGNEIAESADGGRKRSGVRQYHRASNGIFGRAAIYRCGCHRSEQCGRARIKRHAANQGSAGAGYGVAWLGSIRHEQIYALKSASWRIAKSCCKRLCREPESRKGIAAG